MSHSLLSDQFDYSLLKTVGTNPFISAKAEIRRPHLVSIGNNVAIDSGVYITTQLELKDYIHIAAYTTIIGGKDGLLKMGNFSGISAGCRLICASDEYLGHGLIGPTIPEQFHDNIICKPIVFEDFVTIGTNVVVMPGVKLAIGSVVGACSLVVKDTEPWTIYVGTPAKPVKIRPHEKMLAFAKELGY